MAEQIVGITSDGKKLVLVETTGPASYSTGGFSVTVSSVNNIIGVIFGKVKGTPADKYVYEYEDTGNYLSVTNVIGPIKVYSQDVTATAATWAEVSAATDLSGLTFRFLVIGV